VPQGIALVDKELGVSSHHIVGKARKALDTKKVGHAGTLDPAASGLLVLGVGSGTRLLTFLVGLGKTYRATMRLGYSTTTDDAEGESLAPTGDVSSCSDSDIARAVENFRGEISQVPSTFSAIKVGGRRAYDLARAGQEVELKSRAVTIFTLEVGAISRHLHHIDVELLVECSSGTYIRALARDIGADLGVGGHLVALRRDRVGPFDVAGTGKAEDLTLDNLMPLGQAARLVMPALEVSGSEVSDLRHGRAIALEGHPTGVPLAAIERDTGVLLAVIEARAGRSRILMGVASN
jgi:tRNA pseudouridine55 synthase